MPEDVTSVPNADKGVQTPPASPSSAELKELEEYKVRLAGAISSMDRARNEVTELKSKSQQRETELAAQLQQKEVEFKSNLIQKETDLAALITAKTVLEQEHEKIRKERDSSSAELARWGFIAENPSMLPYREVLPVTTDVEALKRAADAINKARQVDRQALADQVRGGQAPPVPPSATTLTSAIEALNKAVGTPGFDAALKAYQEVEKAAKK